MCTHWHHAWARGSAKASLNDLTVPVTVRVGRKAFWRVFGGTSEGRSKRLVSVLRPTCAYRGSYFFVEVTYTSTSTNSARAREIEKSPAKGLEMGSQGVGTGLLRFCRAPLPALGHTHK